MPNHTSPSTKTKRFVRSVLIGSLVVVSTVAVVRVLRGVIFQPRLDRDAIAHRIDPNAADAAEISLLPGIGPRLAERIVEDREQQGPFTSIDDLTRVHGIGEKITRRMAPHLEFDATATDEE